MVWKSMFLCGVLVMLGLAGCAPREAKLITKPAQASPAEATPAPTQPGQAGAALTPPASPEKGKERRVPVQTPEEGASLNPPVKTPPLESPEAERPAAVQAAVERLARKLGAAAETIQVTGYERKQWRNACLGFSSLREMCADVITPGWQVRLEAGGKQYEAHTNESGSQVRIR